MRIEVTQEDIDHGVRGSCKECPIARAMQRAGFKFPRVNRYSAWWFFPYGQCDLPDIAQRAVRRFDLGHGMSPFAFDLDVEEA